MLLTRGGWYNEHTEDEPHLGRLTRARTTRRIKVAVGHKITGSRLVGCRLVGCAPATGYLYVGLSLYPNRLSAAASMNRPSTRQCIPEASFMFAL